MTETRWLGLDAAGPGLSACVTRGQDVEALVEWREPKSAGTQLMAWIGHMVESFDVPESIAVGVGPGSFTGVRLAVTAAKTLAWAWGIPVYGVSSLAAAAIMVPGPRWVVASSELRRGEAYIGVYWRGQAGVETLVPDALREVSWAATLALLYQPITFVGPVSGVEDVRRAFPSATTADFASAALGAVRAAQMPAVAPGSALRLRPAYLRSPAVTVPRGERR